MTRLVIIGAGAVGGVVGARLAEAGVDVTLVARGAHAAAMEHDGLILAEPTRTVRIPVPVVRTVAAARIDAFTVVAIAVKSQDIGAVLGELQDCAPPQTPIACFQNGVINERVLGADFPRTYGVVVMMPAAHLEPGRVEAYASPIPGLFDVGLASGAVDDVARDLAGTLCLGGFDARAVPDVMRWKYTKLLMNLGNAVQAMCVLDDAAIELVGRARDEGLACLRAAGIDFASSVEEQERRGDLLQVGTINGTDRAGGSSWQSMARGLGSIESDALNGEIARIGATVGVPAPVNALLLRRALQAAADRLPPASISAADLLAELA